MQNPTDNQSRKILYAIIAISAAFVILIITISVLGSVLGNRKEANIINEPSTTEQTQLISDEALSRVKKELYNHISRSHPNPSKFDTAIRWDTVKTATSTYPSTSFLVDIDQYQQTYQVVVDDSSVVIHCPSLGESKYPESFCAGNQYENDDSIGVVFGSQLPYSGYTSAHEYFSISRNTNRKNTEDPALIVLVSSCSKDQSAKDRANAAVDEVITSLGASPSLFSRQISIVGCHGE